MSAAVLHPFEVQGRFAGFFRNIFGKRRMTLRVGSEEIHLKVPKALRRQLEGVLLAGEEITVFGEQGSDGKSARVVSQVRIAGSEACVSCPIRVCTKKNCWRNGGKELWESLEEQIAGSGASGAIRLEAVDCLGHCKKGPNVECAGRDYPRCTPREAGRILEQMTGEKRAVS